ncbi:hypothetical protein, partial [Micrococcus luteus]|uniref:hypothetical protein n=1 Tax=Micrococcus luteus TaxID=1270 RepID=UPI001C930CC6
MGWDVVGEGFEGVDVEEFGIKDVGRDGGIIGDDVGDGEGGGAVGVEEGEGGGGEGVDLVGV